MNPIQITRNLQSALVNYLTTTFDVNRDGSQQELADAMRFAFQAPGALFNGPFLELTPPYVRGVSLVDLANEGIITHKLITLDCFKQGQPVPVDAPLYKHQEQAIRRISGDEHGVVISSGTGSGKTEAFLIPILNDLLIDPTPGVRALLIYPLNALVNDQLDRLRELLVGTSITFGRYTSELEDRTKDALEQLDHDPMPNEVISREQIRKGEKLPQILITNYAMLEYLLLRPQDSPLFDSGAWRFIVLDEAHTYSGSKGIEVSMLLRRLKLRLGKDKGAIRCIATSATLTTEREQAVTFAETLFGETFSNDDILFGEIDTESLRTDLTESCEPNPNSYLQARVKKLLEDLASVNPPTVAHVAEQLEAVGIITEEDRRAAVDFTDAGTGAFLHHVLQRNAHLNVLRNIMVEDSADAPLSVENAARYAFSTAKLGEADQLEALYRLIELGVQARPTAEKPPLLPARYHLFARPPQGVWLCLNPRCIGRNDKQDTPWSKLYTTVHTTCDYCGCAVYPLAVCRTCGQPYLFGEDIKGVLLTEAPYPGTEHRLYFTWTRLDVNTGLASDLESDDLEATKSTVAEETLDQTAFTLCLNDNCRRSSRCSCQNPTKVTLYAVKDRQQHGATGNRPEPIHALEQCCRCKDKSRVAGTEIATPVTITGNPPVSVLTGELYRRLPPSNKLSLSTKPGAGRKLLTFYDSRQGAARFAAYMQDVFNQDVYRFLVPLAARQFAEKKDYPPDFDSLADLCLTIGWNEFRVFQNDTEVTDTTDIDRSVTRLGRVERDKLIPRVRERLLVEITTNRRSRQSLESLGLIAVEYFEDTPDFSLLQTTGLDEAQISLLLRHLLDTLRTEKAVVLPEGVDRDAKAFGRNVGNPTVVRGKAGNGEVPWIGQTTRHRRYQLIERALRYCDLPTTEENVRQVGRNLLDWLTTSDILAGVGSSGYQIRLSRLFFSVPTEGWAQCSRCQRLYYDGLNLPCPHPTCGGKMIAADLDERNRNNYYYQLLKRDLVPLRVEEHTAQLDSEKGRMYQNAFKNGQINLLSCSTTFEMGIDLGDLQAVVLNNVPPTVANYRQRAGRAGRRVGGAAFILTWARDKPHDQLYFSRPVTIIRGNVRVPRIQIDNVEIRKRHANAVLLANFLRYLYRQGQRTDLDALGNFFDSQSTIQPHISLQADWRQTQLVTLQDELKRFFKSVLGHAPDAAVVLQDFSAALQRESERYEEIATYYREREKESSRQRDYEEAQNYQRLFERLRNERLVDYLSNRGLLPSYSFPLSTVELTLPFKKQDSHLRLQRDLRYAIREYAPGAEVVADKRLWISGGLQFYRDAPQKYHYRLCKNCNFLLLKDQAGVVIEETRCPICNTVLTGSGAFVTPDGFRALSSSGKPAGQFVNILQNQMRSALLIGIQPKMEQLGTLVESGYSRDGRLFYVNEGELGRGFRICMQCGAQVPKNKKRCDGKYRGKKCDSTNIQTLMLGHRVTTDILHLQLRSTAYVHVPQQDKVFWFTLLYALLQGASRALQIERQDIDGLLYPIVDGSNSWKLSLVLYDTVPGGAGHVRDIRDHLLETVQEAYSIVSTCECAANTSCPHCLRDYNNQDFYPFLQRKEVVPFLEALIADLENDPELDDGQVRVVAIDQTRWLMQQVSEAHQQVYIAAQTMSDAILTATHSSWIDILRDLLRRGIQVTVMLQEIPVPRIEDHDSLNLARQILTLMNDSTNPLSVLPIKVLTSWHIVIDPNSAMGEFGRAIRSSSGSFALVEHFHAEELLTSTRPDILSRALGELESILSHGKQLESRTLESPPNVTVHRIDRMYNKRESDIDPIRQFFAKPVKTLYIHDPYLLDRERLLKRVGAYIGLAQQGGCLEHVTIQTGDAKAVGGSREEQNNAIDALQKQYRGLDIQVKRKDSEHDRWIEVQRENGIRARLLIGRGLDFIRNDGTVEPTYIVVQDPL
jgi:ATP-dependent helicase YprA (DUF1998 family)